MYRYVSSLKWIESQYELMITLVEKWAAINSFSEHLTGLAEMIAALSEDFKILEGETEVISLGTRVKIGPKGDQLESPLGQALRIRKRPDAPIQVFLGGHMDTVFPPYESFLTTKRLDENTLRGPGVADLKGGLVILLKAVEALERSPYASKIGWEILINPDEEIGSPGSTPLFQEAAKRNQVGLIFEPSFADGAFVSARKGSGNYTIVVRGKSAHAGRDFTKGRSSIYAIAHIIREIEEQIPSNDETTINIGHIEGGGPINIVPDLAICRINIRTNTTQNFITIKTILEQIIDRCQKREGIQIQLIEDYSRLPKPFDHKTRQLFELYEECAEKLKIPFLTRESGGVCDGNVLSAAGLPTIDSVGAIGGCLHTDEEYLILPSLIERAQLAALFLFKLATGDIAAPAKENTHA